MLRSPTATRRVFDASDGAGESDSIDIHPRSMSIYNNSGLYCLVRIGGPDPPNNIGSADRVISPYTFGTFPVSTAARSFGFYWTANPGSGYPSSAGSLSGQTTVEYSVYTAIDAIVPLPDTTVSEGTYIRGYFDYDPVGAGTTQDIAMTQPVRLTYLAFMPHVAPVGSDTAVYIGTSPGVGNDWLANALEGQSGGDMRPIIWGPVPMERGVNLAIGDVIRIFNRHADISGILYWEYIPITF